jgi:hypothetical protein
MGFPALDIAASNKPWAMLITENNEVKLLVLKKLHQGFFVDVDHGIFMIDPLKALRYGKQSFFIYDVRSARPLNMRAMKLIDEFVKNNGLVRIDRKAVRHGERLRQLLRIGKKPEDAIQELKIEEQKKSDAVHNEIEAINQRLLAENEQRQEENKTPIRIEPDDYANYITERLINSGLITRGDAAKVRFDLISGEITIDDFIRKLEGLHLVEIQEPITPNAQLFVEEYRAFDPAKVMSYIKMAKGLGKDIKDLGQPTIKNLVPVKWIVLAVIGVAIMALVLSNVDLSNIGTLIPFLNK